MCNKMECKVVVCLTLLLVIVRATKVHLSGEWKQDVGWVVNCSWQLFSNDSLQSVRLYDDDRQFMVYRPQLTNNEETKSSVPDPQSWHTFQRKDGDHYVQDFRRTEDMMVVECTESIPRGLIGTCVSTIIPYQSPTKDFTLSCEVSGERPKFRIEKKSYHVNWIVPPTDAKIEVGSWQADTVRVMLNCTSMAWPAPQLTWKIGDQYVPSDFKKSIWNITSKLWHTWSTFSFTPSSQVEVVCIPEITSGNLSLTGGSALYNSDARVKGTIDAALPLTPINCANCRQGFILTILIALLVMK